ncbi:protein lifeguard 1-like [Lucilia sericata]|uniref:protein lifeguard 1-like n=1 Tax=Lucilia sericata TaxID=13632 RepID=UPI0018A86F75|nr:protein lifeguard 1-like [Lucilia sericata]
MNPQGYSQPPPPYTENPGNPPKPMSNQTYGWKESLSADTATTTPLATSTTPIANGDSIDPEDLQSKQFSFDEASVRKGFLRKVYLILMCQLIVTFGVVALFLFHQPTLEFSQQHPRLSMVAMFITIGIGVAMACCESARRKYPTNFICLGIFTIAESFLVGTIAGRYNSESVLMAVGITAFLCLALTIFALQTKYDFTVCGGFLICAMVCLLIFGIVGIFWRNHILHTIYAGCGALLACFFLIFDTQMMMGGHHKYSISPEEYAFAALNLYMDIIRIFIFILKLLGKKKD